VKAQTSSREGLSSKTIKPRLLTATALAAGILVLVLRPAFAESAVLPGAVALTVAPGASLELDGDSTLHHYSAKAHGLEIGVKIDPARATEAGRPSDVESLIRGHVVRTLELTVPVDKLSSGERGLDANLRKALKGDRYKQIRFEMDSYEVLAPSAGASGFVITMHGRLSLAGVEKKIDVSAKGVRLNGSIQLSGSKDLLMTDYQIKPPTMMLGAIKTANLITVKFNATLQKGI
jgi:polyisoprenoid-binding protein YceI